MNKILIGIIVAILGAVIIGLLVFVIYINSLSGAVPSDQGGTSTNNLPGSNPSTVNVNGGNNGTPVAQDSDTLSLSTADGGALVVANIKKDPALKEDPANKGYYYFSGSQNASTSVAAPYTFEYIDSTQFFNIVLKEEPIGQAREQAQSYLAQHLGISQDKLCYLNYMVTVPYSVNQDFASVDLRFSTCSDATP